MNTHTVISLNRRENSRVMHTHYSGVSPLYSAVNFDSLQPQCIPPKPVNSITTQLQQKTNANPVPNHSPSSTSHSPGLKSTMFCTDLHLSSMKSSETNRPLGISPFLPHPHPSPPIVNLVIPSIESSLFMGGAMTTESENDNLNSLMDLFDIPSKLPIGRFQGSQPATQGLVFTEQMGLEYISKELGIDDDRNDPMLDVSTTATIISFFTALNI